MLLTSVRRRISSHRIGRQYFPMMCNASVTLKQSAGSGLTPRSPGQRDVARASGLRRFFWNESCMVFVDAVSNLPI
jgi:hypothetical protein